MASKKSAVFVAFVFALHALSSGAAANPVAHLGNGLLRKQRDGGFVKRDGLYPSARKSIGSGRMELETSDREEISTESDAEATAEATEEPKDLACTGCIYYYDWCSIILRDYCQKGNSIAELYADEDQEGLYDDPCCVARYYCRVAEETCTNGLTSFCGFRKQASIGKQEMAENANITTTTGITEQYCQQNYSFSGGEYFW